MNDNAINRAILTVYFAILSLLLFFGLIFSIAYLTLGGGIDVRHFNRGPLQIEGLSVHWEGKLHVRADVIRVRHEEGAEDGDVSAGLRRLFTLLGSGNRWLASIRIRDLVVGDTRMRLSLDEHLSGVVDLNATGMRHRLYLHPAASGIRLMRLESTLAEYNTTARTQMVLDAPAQKLYVASRLKAPGEVVLQADAVVSPTEAAFHLHSPEPFADADPLFAVLPLSANARPWVIDNTEGGPIMLHALRGRIDFARPETLLQSLEGHLTYEKLRYRFAPGFEPIRTEFTTLLFQNGVLKILPAATTFHSIKGGSTWLDINFNPAQIPLNLHLSINARFDETLHRLLQSYGIHLPFRQTRGRTRAAMELRINLDTGDTDAVGHFEVPDGAMDFHGIPVTLHQSRFKVHNSNVTFDRLHLSLLDGAVAGTMHGTIDPVRDAGTMHFALDRADFGVVSLRSDPLHLDYTLRPGMDAITMNDTVWQNGPHAVKLGGFTAPFNYKAFRLRLPTTPLQIGQKLEAQVRGTVMPATGAFNLALDLTRLDVAGIRSGDPLTPVTLRYDGNLSLTLPKPSRWTIGDVPFRVAPIRADLTDEHLHLTPTRIIVEGKADARVQGTADLRTQQADLNFTSMILEDPMLGRLFGSDEALNLKVRMEAERTEVTFPQLALQYESFPDGWMLHLFRLQTLAQKMPLLTEYNLTRGHAVLYADRDDGPVQLEGTFTYPYAIIRRNGEPMTRFCFHGEYTPVGLEVTLNDVIDLHVDHNLTLRTRGVDFNVSEIRRFVDDHPPTPQTSAHMPIYLVSEQADLLLPGGRKAPTDLMQAQYEQGRLTAQIIKGEGGIAFESEAGELTLFGKRLDAEFMNATLRISRFQGGTMRFFLHGTAQSLEGYVRVDNTTIRDYVVLNNLFAFFNTVPALITFSLPGYSRRGLHVNTAYAKLGYDNRQLRVDGIRVDSDEIDLQGEGTLDYDSEQIDFELSVKTQADQNLRKIPIVGYILVGDDNSIITTVKVRGDVNDPKISNTIAKDIAIAPFNILKRTLNFPLHYLEQLDNRSH